VARSPRRAVEKAAFEGVRGGHVLKR